MKNIKTKRLIIFFILLIFVISIFSVTCFADSDNGVFNKGDSFIFNEVIFLNVLPSSPSLNGAFHVVDSYGANIDFTDIEVRYRGYLIIVFKSYDSYGSLTWSEEVYVDGEWSADYYRHVYVDQFVQFTGEDLAFLYLNTSDPVSNYYSQIYDIIIDSLYGDIPLTSDMTLSASLVSTILSMIVVLAPVLVGGFIFVWILKRF